MRLLSQILLSFIFFLSLIKGDEKKTNILFILADDVGYEGLGCYGGESYSTPKLDRLAKNGIQAMHCYSMPVCHPTRIALLTGSYPKNVGSPRWGDFPKGLEKKTIAQALKGGGYRTAVSGKWQLTLLKDDPKQPFRMGFDDYCVFGWHEGPRYHDPMIYENGSVRTGTKNKFGPDIYREFLESFMSKSLKEEKPFFAFYSMALCHDVTDDLKEPVPVSPSGKYLNYKEMVAEMDRQVGLLVSFLDKNKIRENTLLIFVADNGTPSRFISYPKGKKLIKEPIFSNLNGRKIQGGKGKLDDTGTRVPMIINWPSVVSSGKKTDALIDMADFHATFSEVAGLKVNKNIDGISFLPIFDGKDSKKSWAYSERKGKWWVRDQKYKLYNDGKFVEVSSTNPGNEISLNGKLNKSQKAAFLVLDSARQNLTN